MLLAVLPPVKAWGELHADAVTRMHELNLHTFPLTAEEYELLRIRLGQRRPDLVIRLLPLLRVEPGMVLKGDVAGESVEDRL